jgi:uncharacterized membrane protein
MVKMSVNSVKAEYIIVFALGIFFLACGVYGVFYLLTVELPSGQFSRVPFAAAAGFFLGTVMIWQTHKIFIPLSKVHSTTRVCPFCGALVEATAVPCEKCKRQLED